MVRILNNILKGIVKNKLLFTLLALLLLNLLVKLPFCTISSISNDEAFSIFYSQFSVHEIVDFFKQDSNPPFFYILLHAWIGAFGIDEFSVRSFSVIVSSLAACMVFLLGEKFLSFRTALVAALFFTFSPANIYYAQEVRTFSLVLLFSVVSVFAFLNLFYQDKKKLVWATVLGIMSLVLLWSHYLTIFLLLVEFAFSFSLMKLSCKGFKYYLGSQIIAALIFSPWILFIFVNMPENGDFWLDTPSFKDLFFGAFQLAGSRPALFFVIILTLIAIFSGLKSNRKFLFRTFDSFFFWFFLALWLIPIVGEFLLGQITPIFLLRYFLYSGIGLFLLESYILDKVANRFARNLLTFTAFILLMVSFKFAPAKEENWRAVAYYIKENKSANTQILLSASYKARDLYYYLDRSLFTDYQNFEKLADEHLIRVNTAEELSKKDLRAKKLIVIYAHHELVDPEDLISNKLSEQYTKTSEQSFNRVNVSLYQKN